MRVVNKKTGASISPAYIKRLEAIKKSLEKGVVINKADFEKAGIKSGNISDALARLQGGFDVDVLTIKRGNVLVGWILADEVL